MTGRVLAYQHTPLLCDVCGCPIDPDVHHHTPHEQGCEGEGCACDFTVHPECCWACAPRLVCIIPGPDKELRREPAGERWCFGCRKRLPHDDVLMGDSEPSYYDPVWMRQCCRCGKDRTTYPEREALL